MPSHTARWVATIAGALLAGLVVLLATGNLGEATDRSPLIGKPAPQISGTTMDGQEFELSAHRGRWAVVNFFASWCAPCRVEHPELLAFAQRHQDDATVLSVASGDTVEDARAFFEELGGDWPVLVEDTGPIAITYGVVKVPETYLISPEGIVVEKWISNITASDLERGISRAKGGR